VTSTSDDLGSWSDSDPCAFAAGRRRRGQQLERAIHEAALAELAEHGLGALTMEGVAAAARTGKASLYRRWSSKEELVLDAVGCTMPGTEEYELSTGSLRGDLLRLLTAMAEFVSGPQGGVVRSLLGTAEPEHPLLEMARSRLIEPRLERQRRIIEQGIERGEARPGAATRTLAQVGPAVVLHRFLLHGRVTADDVRVIVDEVVLPLLRVDRSGDETPERLTS
jgi:AcrR family transcriptional regulator